MTVGVHEASVASGRTSANKKRFLGRAASSTLIWCVAALTMAGTIGISAEANAATYWSDTDYGYSQPAPTTVPQRAPKVRRHAGKKTEPQVAVKEAAKPQGPLIIAISINKQSLKVYDDNGFFAETPISTGMRGHATPMGAFSVIQKQKMHRSNIYSGAPMPFMQRITWSGIAMHAGVLPGYPASHGCIRMPMAFAVKMYGWTRMGARVVIAPGELSPAPFSHPLLVTQKVVPQPVAADVPKPDSAAKTDKVASAEPAAPGPKLELRSTVGHDDHLSAMLNEPAAPAPLSDQTRTADASASPAQVTMSDAKASAPVAADEAKPDAVKAEAEPVTAEITDKTAEAASPDKPIMAKVAELATADHADHAAAE